MIEIVNGDAETIEKLADLIWHEHYKSILSASQIDYMLEKFQSAGAVREDIENRGYRYYIVRYADADAGYFGIRQEKKKLFLSKLYILKSFRGRRLASAAMSFCEKFCAEKGLSAVYLTVNKNNADSIAVYEKFGFIRVESIVTDIGNGYVMDDFKMEKRLEI